MPAEPRFPRAILWGWLIAGGLDITAACIEANLTFGFSPVRLLQNVAGALLGPKTYEFGFVSAALGLAMHFTVALAWMAVLYLLTRRFPALLRWAPLTGLVYGALVFLAMFRVVIPLTMELKSLYLANVTRTLPALRLPQFIIHLFCVGLPMALAAKRFAKPASPRAA